MVLVVVVVEVVEVVEVVDFEELEPDRVTEDADDEGFDIRGGLVGFCVVVVVIVFEVGDGERGGDESVNAIAALVAGDIDNSSSSSSSSLTYPAARTAACTGPDLS